MALRPVESNWYRDFMYNLTNTKSRFDTAITQSTSGKRLNNLSDDPSDMAYVLTLRSKVDQIDQYDKNISSAYAYLDTAESSLNQVENLLYSVVTLATQGASEDNGNDEREMIADRVEAIREELLTYANAQVMGKYVFAGSATDTAPYEEQALPAVAGEPNQINFVGNNDEIEIQADFSITVATNIPGSEIFGDTATAANPPPPTR